jgi:creatinine amidohydrolase/Fe(II)-dependent formamide hydrolase-like protein
MLNARVRDLMRSPRPDFEWHSGELETSLVLAVRPDLVKTSVLRGLPPAWVDFRAALAKGARRFEEIAPGGRGYFGWPAVARATTGRRMLALRARLIAREMIRALRSWRATPSSRRKMC